MAKVKKVERGRPLGLNNKSESLHIKLTKEINNRIEELATSAGLSKAAWVRILIINKIKKQEKNDWK